MIAHVAQKLGLLAGTCEISDGDCVHGWSVDFWELSESSVTAMRDTYRALINPPALANVVQTLLADGVDLGKIFFDATGANKANLERIIRADMLELAAASTMMAVEGIDIATLVMPNVPKGSRKQSAPGIDVLALRLHEFGDPSRLEDGEVLFIGSVKHTVGGCADLRLELDLSVSEQTLTTAYLGQQLRVLHGELEQRGYDVSRVFLVLRSDPILNPDHVKIVAVGCVDCTERDALTAQAKQLTQSPSGLRRLRWLLVPKLAELHTRASQ